MRILTAFCRRKVCALPEEAKAETEVKSNDMEKLVNNPVFCKKAKKQLAQMGFTFHKMYAANYPTMWYTIKGKSLIVWLTEKDITLAGHGFGSEFTKSFLELPIGCYNINIETGDFLVKPTPFDYVDGFSEHWITETQKQLLQILNQII